MEPSTHTPAGPAEPQMGRRAFFQWLTAGLGAIATVILGAPVVAFLLGVPKKPPQDELWVSLGPPGDFPENETLMRTFQNPLQQPWDGMAAHTGVFVRNEGEGKFLVLAVNCAHLGCPVTWFPQSGLFMCPCHGGVYYANGLRASGPPPRGLFRCEYRVTEQGILQVQAPSYPSLQAPLLKDDTGEASHKG